MIDLTQDEWDMYCEAKGRRWSNVERATELDRQAAILWLMRDQ
jgi:hypothetical protein